MTARLECSITAGENGFFHVVGRSTGSTREETFEILDILLGMTSGKTHAMRSPLEVKSERDFDTKEIVYTGCIRFSLKNEPGEEMLAAPVPPNELPYIQFLWRSHYGGR